MDTPEYHPGPNLSGNFYKSYGTEVRRAGDHFSPSLRYTCETLVLPECSYSLAVPHPMH